MNIADWLRNYYYRALVHIFTFIIPKDKKILHIGCKDGRILAQLHASRGVGIDDNPTTVASAKANYPSLTFYSTSPENFSPTEKLTLNIFLN